MVLSPEGHQSKFYHLGFGSSISRRNLGTANERLSYKIFEEFAYVLIDEARCGCYKTDFEVNVDGNVYAFRLIRIVIILAGIIISYPFLPGSGSEIFKGFFLFIGAVITFPNGQVLGSSIVNLSSLAKTEGLFVNAFIGISYDVDWRKVHELMRKAAMKTTGVHSIPEPFVLETDLGDFAVTYKVMTKITEPKKILIIEAELRRNLLDVFNSEGLEIMSPSVTAIRESTSPMIPIEYNPLPFSFPGKKNNK